MGILFVILVLAALGLIAAWNFVPAFREKMKGWSTILEGVLATVLMYFGMVTEGLQEAAKAGYIPAGWEVYLPMLFLAWVVVKRFQTKTPVGKK